MAQSGAPGGGAGGGGRPRAARTASATRPALRRREDIVQAAERGGLLLLAGGDDLGDSGLVAGDLCRVQLALLDGGDEIGVQRGSSRGATRRIALRATLRAWRSRSSGRRRGRLSCAALKNIPASPSGASLASRALPRRTASAPGAASGASTAAEAAASGCASTGAAVDGVAPVACRRQDDRRDRSLEMRFMFLPAWLRSKHAGATTTGRPVRRKRRAVGKDAGQRSGHL